MPVALIDWDSVHAGDPLEDVGYAGWAWCTQANGHVPLGDQAERLRRFRDGYDPTLPPAMLLRAIQERQRSVARVESRVRDRRSTSAVRRAHAEAAIPWAEGDRGLLERNSVAFLDALTS